MQNTKPVRQLVHEHPSLSLVWSYDADEMQHLLWAEVLSKMTAQHDNEVCFHTVVHRSPKYMTLITLQVPEYDQRTSSTNKITNFDENSPV